MSNPDPGPGPGSDPGPPLAAIFACAGPALSDAERSFFADARPLGFILFRRSCENPAQLRRLVADLRAAAGRPDAPVLIDQEGGRVARLGPPHWKPRPPARRFGALAGRDLAAAREAATANARLIAADLAALGIDVDCAPVLDVPAAGAHDVIGDRAYGADPALVAALGRAACDGFLAGGVLPVVKHVPGHGRARADSHVALPIVDAPRERLRAADFPPFRALADMPLAMTAHVVYSDIDAAAPASASPRVIEEVVRGEIGFEGALISDDIGMGALDGPLGRRAKAVLAAGCDLVLHCSGDPGEMAEVAEAAGPLGGAALARVERALARRRAPAPVDAAALEARLAELLPPAAA